MSFSPSKPKQGESDRYYPRLVIIAKPRTIEPRGPSNRSIYPLLEVTGKKRLPSFAKFVIRVDGPLRAWEKDFVAQKVAIRVRIPNPAGREHLESFQGRHYVQYHQDDWYYSEESPNPVDVPAKPDLIIEVHKTKDPPIDVRELRQLVASTRSDPNQTDDQNLGLKVLGRHRAGRRVQRKRQREAGGDR